ncbi:hypothetical protein [Loktanella sp. S4079]|uniref:hypothetical protein n=1 Tax=Loktanella sp. S4079 TaxID=579483 RepID=UPI0006970F5F|nr:hypothetical protein [Loktanella sp. S4079]
MTGNSSRATIAFFGHNANEPAVRRRAQFFQTAGATVIGIMPHRGEPKPAPFDVISLGETRDNSYLARLGTVVKSLTMRPCTIPQLHDIDVLYARNLDMLICAHAFRLRHRLRVPIVYECLDIHALLIGSGRAASALRRLEGALLRKSDTLVYSSERFVDQYFDIHHPGTYQKILVENRINPADVPPRPTAISTNPDTALKIGWIGNLRCCKSLELLKQIGRDFAPNVEIHIHGYPAQNVFPDFGGDIKDAPGVTYHGPYNGAQDLAAIYSSIDVVWATDWYEAGHNSVWQIPNRLYEGGYFGVPAITLNGTETGRIVQSWGAGWQFDAPAQETVPALIQTLVNDRAQIAAKANALLSLPMATFVETPEDTRSFIAKIIASAS